MRELLRQRRWLSFSVFALGMFVLCLALSRWQWHRYHVRLAENALLSEAVAAPPTPITQILRPVEGLVVDPPLPPELTWREVTAVGTFDSDHEVAVRRRPLDGRNGYWIVTPLRTDTSTLLVNRGWVGANTSDTKIAPTVPAPPTGEVEVRGRLRAAEWTRTQDLAPNGQAWAAEPRRLLPATEPRYPAYLDMTSSMPSAADGLIALGEVPEKRGMNNLIYAGQWLIFALVVGLGWWRMLRQEARLQRPDRSGQESDLLLDRGDRVT